MRISTTGNALSLTFLMAYLPLALLRLAHVAGGGGWQGPTAQTMPQAGGMAQGMHAAGAMGQGWMMNGAHAGGWHMAGYGYGAYGLSHVILGAVAAYVIGWYVAAIFVTLYRWFERRASNKPD